MDKFLITKKGFTKLQADLSRLESIERKLVISEIEEARKHGDLSENAEYHAAKEKQKIVEAKIADLSLALSTCSVVSSSDVKHDKVRFGATVTLVDNKENKKTVTIVSKYEIDPQNGLISVESPIAKSLIGKSSSDQITIGNIEYEITDIDYNYIS